MNENILRQKSNSIVRKSRNLGMAFIILSDMIKTDINLSNKMELDSLDFFREVSARKDSFLNATDLGFLGKKINLLKAYAKLVFQKEKVSLSNYNMLYEYTRDLEKEIVVYKNNTLGASVWHDENQLALGRVLRDSLANDKKSIKDIFDENVKDKSYKDENKKDTIGHKKVKSSEITERQERLLFVLKNKGALSITEILPHFSNVAIKTIQRDLNSLVSDNKVIATGARRWVRYTHK